MNGKDDSKRIALDIYATLEEDFVECLKFVDLSSKNFDAYGIRFYELIIRICNEFESLCKAFLDKVQPGRNKNQDNIALYRRTLEDTLITKISSIKVRTFIGEIEFKPCEEFANNLSPDWWKVYTDLKHNVNKEIDSANLKNTLYCIGALYLILQIVYSVYDSREDYPPETPYEFIKSKIFYTLRNDIYYDPAILSGFDI